MEITRQNETAQHENVRRSIKNKTNNVHNPSEWVNSRRLNVFIGIQVLKFFYFFKVFSCNLNVFLVAPRFILIYERTLKLKLCADRVVINHRDSY